jgi:hypothetical protein
VCSLLLSPARLSVLASFSYNKIQIFRDLSTSLLSSPEPQPKRLLFLAFMRLFSADGRGLSSRASDASKNVQECTSRREFPAHTVSQPFANIHSYLMSKKKRYEARFFSGKKFPISPAETREREQRFSISIKLNYIGKQRHKNNFGNV